MRSLLSPNSSALSSNHYLKFGGAGLLILRPIQLTANQIFRFKLFLKRASRKVDRTRRFVWFCAFPHLPLTRKPNGTRMGKGKGKLEGWFTNVSGGSILIEFKNLRYGRASYFMFQMTHKLGIETKHVFTENLAHVPLPLNRAKVAPLRIFW